MTKTTYTCDKCGVTDSEPLAILVKGYWPMKAGGILLPEKFKEHHLCSHSCFVAWMRESLTKE